MVMFGLVVHYHHPAYDEVWSANSSPSGTICNGLDMVAAFMLETYPRVLVESILYMAQVPERPVKYEKTKLGSGVMRTGLWLGSLMLQLMGVKLS
jgi:hypothetical protein